MSPVFIKHQKCNVRSSYLANQSVTKLKTAFLELCSQLLNFILSFQNLMTQMRKSPLEINYEAKKEIQICLILLILFNFIFKSSALKSSHYEAFDNKSRCSNLAFMNSNQENSLKILIGQLCLPRSAYKPNFLHMPKLQASNPQK